MTAILANASNFLFTSDYPIDKVVYETSGLFAVPYPTGGTPLNITHNLPFTPLVGGNWSPKADFSTAYEYFSGTLPSQNSSSLFNISLNIKANGSLIVLDPVNVSGAATSAYYRIFALEPSTSAAALSATQASADSFSLNMDYNYPKLYLSDYVPVPSEVPITVHHGLGYVPQVMAWATYSDGWVKPIIFGTKYGDNTPQEVIVEVTTNDIIITRDTTSTAVTRVDYRIYADAL